MKNNFFRKWLALSALFAFMCFSPHELLRAQSIANYAFSTSTTGTLEDLSVGSTSIMTAAVHDDDVTTVNPLGFNFTFMGVTYSHFSANSNGQFQFHTSGSATAIGANVTPSAGVPNLFPMTGDNELSGGIRYKVIGSAPNRKFVLEWSQFYVYYTDITNAGNMQLWLNESNGQIDFVYGAIYNSNSISVTRSIGIATGTTATTQGSVTVGASPTYAASGTFTTNTFAAGSGTATGSPLIANLGTSVEGTRRVYSFTPAAAPAVASGLSFSGIAATTMTLNWTDNASTEVGYRIYRSLDDITYTAIANLPANTATYSATSLNANTLYYWRVIAYAEIEGAALSGSQSTNPAAFAAGIKTVGAGGDYQNLTTAFADINAQALIGNVELQLISGYPAAPETYPILSCNAAATGAFTVKVYPTVSGLSITSANATGTLNLNNATNVTFDGRVNQTGAADLVISNTNAGASYAIQFVNDAKSNTLQYLTIHSANNSATSGTIVFAGSTGTTGNDNNLIDRCDIKDGATTPLNGIYSAGASTTVDNSGNIVSNSNIYNYFGAATASNGILLSSNSAAWTISANKFYQTATRTLTGGSQHRGINIITSNGNGYVITNNVIGYASSTATGVTTYTASAGRFFGIELSASNTGTASSIQGNTISGISLTSTSGTTTAPGIFAGISVLSGTVNVGNVTPNIIGAATGNGAITVSNSTSASIFGIHSSSTGTLNISNNVIGAVNGAGNAAGIVCNMTAINNTGSSTATTISGNTIGGATTNSIAIGTLGTSTGGGTFFGISSTGSHTTFTASGNTISNVSNYHNNTSSVLNGIVSSGTPTTMVVNNNTISNLLLAAGTLSNINAGGSTTLTASGNNISNASITGASGTIYGIQAGTTQFTFNNNIIHDLAFTANSGTSSSNIYGIYDLSSPTAENITNNQIYNLSVAGATTSTSSVVAGVHTNTTSSSIKNFSGNVINGLSFANSSTGTVTMNGISSASGATISIFKNKIYNLSASGTTSSVNGIVMSSGTTGNVYNNVIGDLKTPTASAADPIRGISINSSATATYRVYYNSVYLNASSSGTNFGTSGIYHTTSGTATTAALDMRNNIIINESTPSGTGITVAFRRSSAVLTNFASTSNRNLLYAGTASATRLIMYDGTNSYQTMTAYQTAVLPREANSFTGEAAFTGTGYGTAGNFFISTTPANANYLKPVAGATTQVESGAANITTPAITDDYAAVIRQGNAGYTGTGTAPDLGAFEFDGTQVTPVITLNSVTPPATTQCVATARVVSVNITTASGTVTGATIGYTVNGVAQTNIVMTNVSGTTWTGTIPVPTPANATIAWGVAAQNSLGLTSSYTGASYSDEPLTGVTATATASASPICAGSPSVLTATLAKNGAATIGTATTLTGATAQPTAFCNRWSSYRMQTIYTAAELTAGGLTAGPITSMSFNITTLGDAATNANFVVKIGTTALTAFTDFVSTTGYTTVFPAATYTHAVGVNVINFSTPYMWDGTSNIVVEVSHDGANATNNAQTYYTATAGNMVAWSTNGGATGTLSVNRLNVTLTGGIVPPISAISWSDGATTVGTTNSLSVTPATTTTYTATITAAGCTVTPAPTVSVTVNPLPTAPTGVNSAQCGVQVPTANVTSTSGLPTPTFKWYSASSGGTVMQNSTSTTYTSTVSSTTTFYVAEVNTSTGCESGRTAVTVTVSSPDPILASVNNATICVGSSVTLTAVNTSGTPFQSYTYTWTSAAGSGVTSTTGASITATPTAPGTYTYNVTGVDGGCSAVSSVNVTVDPFTVVLSPVNVTCNGYNNGTFTQGAVTCGTAPYTYSVDGGAFVGTIPTNLTPGTHTVVVMNSLGFTSASQNITITEPSTVINNPVGTNASVCQNSSSAMVSATSSTSAFGAPVTVVIPFNVASQPTELSANSVPTVAASPNVISTAVMAALPAGSVITSATLNYNNIQATASSWMSDVRLGLSGAATQPYTGGTGSTNAAGTFNYTATVTPASVNVAGGSISLHYFDYFNDNSSASEATFPTGAGVANLTITYTPPALATISWWNASTGGTQIGSGSPFQTLGTSVLPNTSTPGVYTVYAQGEYNSCSGLTRTPVTVTVKPTSASTTTVSACATYTWNGTTYNASGTYTHTLTNSVGCDSIATLNLTIKNNTAATVSQTSCSTYTWPINGQTYTTSGTHTATIPNSVGCDSVITLNLTINQPTTATVNHSACNTYTWPINGQTYTTSGVHTATIMNAAGCDSVITLNLTINTPTTGTDVQTACVSYTWIDGVTYTASNNTATHTIVGGNSNGCDSIVTLNLTINNPTTGTDVQTACVSYTWIDGVTYTASNNTATHTIVGGNSNGCDSIVTLNLTINQPTTNTVTETECTSYTWAQNGMTYTASGMYNDTIPNAAGCDSIITLDLTIIQPTTSSVSVSECTSYTWPQNGMTYTASGAYTDTIPNGLGCDSIITLNLTITTPTSSVFTVTTCSPSYTWAQNGTVYNASGMYNDTITNAAGCDSVVTLNLTITNFVATATDNGNATITASAGTTYQWINCTTNTPIAGATAQTFAATANGTYAVIVSNGTCSDTSNCVNITNVGIKENTISTISVHPNPTHDVVIVTMDASSAIVEVMDVQGKLVQTTQIKSGDQVDLSAYERGVYTLRIKTELGTSIERIVKN
jgi:hypothetical protein